MRRHALAATLLLGAVPALAQDRPPIFPTRDVAVSYRFTGQSMPQGAPQGMTMSWQAATQMLRSDIPGMGWMVADQKSGRAFMVMEQVRMIMDIPLGQAMAQHGPSPNATFRREGTDRVAGLPCTIWSYQDGGNQGRACVTADGVTLRAQGTHQGQSGGMEATEVRYGPQDAARFQRPAGYQAMQMPQGMPPGMAPRPPGR
jgi:hypothetical protein